MPGQRTAGRRAHIEQTFQDVRLTTVTARPGLIHAGLAYRLWRAAVALGGTLLLAVLAGCTTTPIGTGTSALTTVTPDRLCPETGTARQDAPALTECISTKVSQYWSGQLGQQVERLIVVAPDPSTVPEECRTFLSFGTAFYCAVDASAYITEEALDRDALAFDEELPYAIASIVAHEFGHVVQYLVGQPGINRSGQTDAQSRVFEQQADCLAGVWVGHATRLGQVNPLAFRAAFEQELTIIHALPVPQGVGLDDYDETATHGTVEERIAAFDNGVAGGSGRACNVIGLDGD